MYIENSMAQIHLMSLQLLKPTDIIRNEHRFTQRYRWKDVLIFIKTYCLISSFLLWFPHDSPCILDGGRHKKKTQMKEMWMQFWWNGTCTASPLIPVCCFTSLCQVKMDKWQKIGKKMPVIQTVSRIIYVKIKICVYDVIVQGSTTFLSLIAILKGSC